MPKTDLDYFHESALYDGNLKSFCKSLPDDLRKQFEKCLNAPIYWINILRGYRGPSHMCSGDSEDSEILSTFFGLTEIKFRWGIRKWMNVLTLGFALFVQKQLKHLEWSSLYFDSKTGTCMGHTKDDAADRLNDRGSTLFENGRYADAAEYFKNAYQACSSEYMRKAIFKNNLIKAESELKAISLNSEGDTLFAQGKYREAIDKYTEARNMSQMQVNEANRKKVQVELDARDLCCQADNLLKQGKYIEAEDKYKEAYNTSQVQREKIKYNDKIVKLRIIINNLRTLDTLWDQAWDAENNDRDEEGIQIFQRILSISKGSLELKNFESLVTLKIKGNEAFNQALELQEIGNTLIEITQETKCQENYELAKIKFKEANNYLCEARGHFEMACKSDQRFQSCIEIVKDQIDVLKQSMELIDDRMLSLIFSLDTNSNDNVDMDTYELVEAEECNTNQLQI